ncbi:hypothetical protein AC579_4511 [Pseudocercospora musae]|uniref:Uncharacterized protein n=1 Tax=Pseudocercospora musae TaxID=113226 RepID=A0A139ID40_9PEZI|nr:hypothetical protein AC579_4511 [Pseudocercospora musae]
MAGTTSPPSDKVRKDYFNSLPNELREQIAGHLHLPTRQATTDYSTLSFDGLPSPTCKPSRSSLLHGTPDIMVSSNRTIF